MEGLSRRALIVAGFSLLAVARAGEAASRPPRPPATERPALAARQPTRCVLLAAARAGDRLVVAGERGLVLWSDDAGGSWTQAEVPVSVSLTSLVFADAQRGWAAGHMGVVLRTGDGGRTWERVLEGRQAAELIDAATRSAWQSASSGIDEPAMTPESAEQLLSEGADKPLLRIALRRDGSLIAAGAYGLALIGRDAGGQWTSLMHALPNPEGFSIYGFAERGGEQWLFGELGLLLRADAPDAPFVPAAAPTQATLFDGLALRDGTLLLTGLRGKVLRSAEPGAAFDVVSTPIDASLCCGLELDDGRVAVAGAAGQLLISRDAGRSFQPATPENRFPFSAMAATPDGALLLAGQRGLMRVDV